MVTDNNNRIVTNSNTLASRPMTQDEISRAAAIKSRTAAQRAEAVARYVTARARVLAAAPTPWCWHNPVNTNAQFEKLVCQAWSADHPERASGKPWHPADWADYAEKVAEKYAPKLPYYAHHGSDPSARG